MASDRFEKLFLWISEHYISPIRQQNITKNSSPYISRKKTQVKGESVDAPEFQFSLYYNTNQNCIDVLVVETAKEIIYTTATILHARNLTLEELAILRKLMLAKIYINDSLLDYKIEGDIWSDDNDKYGLSFTSPNEVDYLGYHVRFIEGVKAVLEKIPKDGNAKTFLKKLQDSLQNGRNGT